MNKLFLVIAMTAAVSGTAYAQSGTPEDQRACSANVKRYCARAIQGGDFAILGCLQQNRTRLSPSCQRMLVKYGQ